MDIIEILEKIRVASGRARTVGLPDDVLRRFAAADPSLLHAAQTALDAHRRLAAEFPDIVALDEPAQVAAIQADLVNFYAADAVHPYVALAARGPWIVTGCGAVLHDSGGYGMLGFGHDPEAITHAMARPHVMANVMTASYSQLRFTRALRREIGHA